MTPIDPAKLKEKQQIIGGYTNGLLQSAVIWVGTEVGLFAAMTDGAPRTAESLATQLNVHPRFVTEWLRAAAGGRLLEYDGEDAFHLSLEVASLLADDSNLASAKWFFVDLPHRVSLWEKVPESFRTGIGMGWEERGERSVTMMESGFRTWYEQVLVQRALPTVDGLVAQLEAGIRVADLGCGAGIAIAQMARAFPRSEFHGYDISQAALARAAYNNAGLANVHLHRVPEELLPGDASFGLVTTFDCMHDMTTPHQTAEAIHAGLAQDGVWFIADIQSFPTFEENLASNPTAGRFYAISLLSCLQSAMSEPGGAGYGTLGLPEPKMEELAREAGFTQFRRLPIQSPVNAYYEVRK